MSPTPRHRSPQVLAVLVLLTVLPAGADTYIVDRFDDSTIDTCSILFNDCALRGAIIKANQHPGDDIVNLGTGNEIAVGYGGAAVNSISAAPDETWILDSWITGNTAGTDAESILVARTARIDGSTVSGNTVWGRPVVDVWGAGSLLINSTFETSGAYSGVAVYIWGGSTLIEGCTLTSDGPTLAAAAAYLRNTLLVGGCTSGSTLTSLDGNLESPGDTCGFGASDLVNVPDPMLSDLGFLGGPTPTHRPLPGSPAVDQPIAAAGCLSVDQRGLARPQDGGGSSAAICDIGAVELAGAGEIFVEGFECGFSTAWSAALW